MAGKNAFRRRVPTVVWKGRLYFVDLRLGELRSVSGPEQGIEFVEFDSPKGRRVWDGLAIFECPWCATKNVGNQPATGLRCWRCDRELPE